MRYALLIVAWLAPLCAQQPIPPTPMKATISNLDKEPPPFIPDEKDLHAAQVRATDQRHAAENRLEMKMAEQGAKVMYYNSAAELNRSLAERVRY